ncbi:MAG: DUF2617 family protein [Pirellulaceae bacterium]
MPQVRPKVAELRFQLYGRTLHPELFEIYSRRTIQREGYSATIAITSAGHFVSWRCGETIMTEVAAAAHHPLPETGKLLSHKLQGRAEDQIRNLDGCSYQVSFQLEPVNLEVFWSFQKALLEDENRKGMLHTFDSSGRVAMGAISYIHIESRNRRLAIQAFHTFPDDSVLVKSQSVFCMP